MCGCNTNPCSCACTTVTTECITGVVPVVPVLTTECPTAPNRMGAEDLTFGCEEEVQLRHCKNVKINQINATHIPYCESGLSLEFYIKELMRMMPYIECQVGRPSMDFDSWDDAQIECAVSCCVPGETPEAYSRIKMNEGDVVRHDGCLWISLVDDNITEPVILPVSTDPQITITWLCLSTIGTKLRSLEECIFPDGLPTMCERMTTVEERLDTIEACAFDENGECPDLALQFISENSGVNITYLDDPTTLAGLPDTNAHFTGVYPADGIITCQWAIDNGLAPVDALDNTQTEWFALGAFGNEPVDNAMASMQGEFYSQEDGYHETPLAYADNVSRTEIEIVALRVYKHANDAFPSDPANPTNPYAGVHEYVKAQVQAIIDNDLNDNTGPDIIALPVFSQWNSAIRDHYLKTVLFPRNGWQNIGHWQPVGWYVRFKNVSASHTTAATFNIDDPSYTPGAMTPQPIATYNNAKISRVSGLYSYNRILIPLVP